MFLLYLMMNGECEEMMNKTPHAKNMVDEDITHDYISNFQSCTIITISNIRYGQFGKLRES